MIGAILAVACWQAAAPGRFARAELELSGPLERARFEIAGNVEVTLEAHLASGEVKLVTLPVPHERDGRELNVIEPRGSAGVRWLGWSREGALELESAWDQLPLALRRRAPVDPLRDARTQPTPIAAGLAVLAVFTCVLALRKRVATACATSILATVGLVAFFVEAPRADGTMRVLEGDGDSGRWIAVDIAWEHWRGSTNAPLWFATVPDNARVRASVDLARPNTWTLSADRTAIRRTLALDPQSHSIDPTQNRWGALDEVWTRGADGVWRFHGAWDAGQALPVGVESAPPGRFNPGLPQGLAVVLARLAAGTFAGPEFGQDLASSSGALEERAGQVASTAGQVWLRWIGPEPDKSR